MPVGTGSLRLESSHECEERAQRIVTIPSIDHTSYTTTSLIDNTLHSAYFTFKPQLEYIPQLNFLQYNRISSLGSYKKPPIIASSPLPHFSSLSSPNHTPPLTFVQIRHYTAILSSPEVVVYIRLKNVDEIEKAGRRMLGRVNEEE